MRWQEGERTSEPDRRDFTWDSAASKGAQRSGVTYPLSSLVRTFVGLRWRLLRGAIRHGGAEQVGAVASLVASAIIGMSGAVVAYTAGRTSSHADELSVIFCTVFVICILGFGVVAGVAQPIDPRVVAPEPLTDREKAVGLLAASAFGPPGLAGITITAGVVIGMTSELGALPITLIAGVSWLLSLLLVARTATNLLALLHSRFPRLGQMTAGLFGLLFYGAFQFVPILLQRLDSDDRTNIANGLALTPPGQLGRAFGDAADRPAMALVHLALGSVWLPFLWAAFMSSAVRLSVSTRRSGGLDTPDAARSVLGRLARRLCGHGVSGAIAWRSLLTRFRTPRTALETFTGAGVGLAAVLVPTLTRDTVGSGAVLVGGAVQLAVLFMSGNSFGSDGPPVTHELLAGAELSDLIAGKGRSIAIVASPLAVIGPLLAATLTGEWRFFVAGLGVGAGALLAGTGAAVIQSALVPIAVPDSDNPFASGESGKGMVAALLLCVVLGALALATLPVAVALIWAIDTGSTTLVTVYGVLTIAIGWIAMQAGIKIATARMRGHEPEFLIAVTPSR
jgi:ABC-2 type transport system permease protein